MMGTATSYPAHALAAEVDSGGVHNCPRCNRLVVWGLTTKGKRARFDHPAGPDGEHVNHHVTCLMDPAKVRAGRLLKPEEAPDCAACHEAIRRGGTFCEMHWREFRGWMATLKPDAYTIWSRGDRQDRRQLLLAWRAA